MKRLCYVTCMALLSPLWAQQKLVLERALPLEGPEFIQPSGLAFSGGTLCLSSAGQDEALYKIDLQADKAVYRPLLKLKLPKDAGERKLAYRGLAADPAGGFYLLSGVACRILKVTPKGAMEWEGPNLLEAGVEKGLFAGENSGAEGLALLGAGKFLVAASRDPRGLIDVDVAGPKPRLKPFVMGKSKVPLARGRKPDYSGLAADNGKVWALAADADAICQIRRQGEEFAEGEYFTFGHVSNDAKYKYAGLRMGLARALAMDAQSVYVALDNKGVARQSDANDKRPLLLVFKKPK